MKGAWVMSSFDVCVIGGCGRVGLPLSIAFADKGLNVVVCDSDKDRMDKVRRGTMPFHEEGCEEKLSRVINNTLFTADGLDPVSSSRFVIVTIGTPAEFDLTSDPHAMLDFFKGMLPYLVPGQHIILRSTVIPGTTARVDRYLRACGAESHVAFCPERILEGSALRELATLPQIVSAFDEECVEAVSGLFSSLTNDIIVLQPLEAELAKLFTNAWRYLQFAAANQFLTLATDSGLDYRRIHQAMTHNYPRTSSLPTPGFAAGPCLFKDTLHLSAFSKGSFSLGQAAMLVNGGLPDYIVNRMKARTDLAKRSIGILGMAFKANSDDERSSLSFRLKALLEPEAKKVCCSDPHVKGDGFVDPQYVIDNCDTIILATPHDEYKGLTIPEDKMLVDIWDVYGKGLIWVPDSLAHDQNGRPEESGDGVLVGRVASGVM
jgi:UDP-N-acetyl-D-mannosaminuronic acid dehydrogenase